MHSTMWLVLLVTMVTSSAALTLESTITYPKLDRMFKDFCSGFKNFLNSIVKSGTHSGTQPIYDANDKIYDILLKLNATLFLELMTKAKLVSILKNHQSNFTVFAPTNEHLEELSNEIKQNSTLLNNILRFHLASGGRMISSFSDNNFLKTLSKYGVASHRQRLYIRTNIYNRLSSNLITASGSEILLSDNTNGLSVVHIIDKLMFPLPKANAYNEILRQPNFSILRRLILKSVALIRVLSEVRDNLTIFAPTNEAFNNLPNGTLHKLEHNIPLLTQTLVQVIISNVYYKASFMDGMTITGINQNTLQLMFKNNDVIITDGKTDATVTDTDISVLNGVIHTINNVFLKQDNPQTPIIG